MVITMRNTYLFNRKVQSDASKRSLYKSNVYSRKNKRFIERHLALTFEDCVSFNDINPVYKNDPFETYSAISNSESNLNHNSDSRTLSLIRDLLIKNGIHSFHDKMNSFRIGTELTERTFEFLEVEFVDDITKPVLFLSCNVSKQIRKNGYLNDYSSAAVLLISISNLLKTLNEYLNVVLLFIDTNNEPNMDDCLIDYLKPFLFNDYQIGGLIEIGEIYGLNLYSESNFGCFHLFNLLQKSNEKYGITEGYKNTLSNINRSEYPSSWLSATNFTDVEFNDDDKFETIFNDVDLLNNYEKESTIEFVKSSDIDVMYTYLVNLCILFSASYK